MTTATKRSARDATAQFLVSAIGGSRVRLLVCAPNMPLAVAGLARAAHALGSAGWGIVVDVDAATPGIVAGDFRCRVEIVTCPRGVDRHGQITDANAGRVAQAAAELLGTYPADLEAARRFARLAIEEVTGAGSRTRRRPTLARTKAAAGAGARRGA